MRSKCRNETHCGYYQTSSRSGATIDDIRQSVSYRMPYTSESLWFVETPGQTVKIFYGLAWPYTQGKGIVFITRNIRPNYTEIQGKIETTAKSNRIIGFFHSERTHTLYVITRDPKAIKYCLIDEVSDE